ncbi:MAG: hypothetical protein C0631_02850 [Sedimenticola sp.]|nr:MAG: hypothetical protein C0631_02850 [Sedimenticola sp.]
MEQLQIIEADRDVFTKLFLALDVPSDLQGLKLVADTFYSLLPYWTVNEQIETIQVWKQKLEDLLKYIDLFEENIKTPNKHPVFIRNWRGVCKNHPLYSVLMTLSLSENVELASSLFALALPSFWQCYHEISIPRRYQIGTALRALFDYRGPDFGDRLTFYGMSRLQVAGDIKMLAESVDSNSGVYLKLISNLLQQELTTHEGGGSGHGRGSNGIRGKPRIRRIQKVKAVLNEYGLPEGEIQHDGIDEVKFITAVPKESAINMAKYGLAPEDHGAQFVEVTEVLQKNQTLSQAIDPARKHIKRRAIKSEISSRVQPIEFKWQVLTPIELNLFLRELAQLAEQGDRVSERVNNSRTAAIVLMSFFRGIEPREVIKMRFLKSSSPEDTNNILHYLWIDQSSRDLRLFLSGQILKGGGVVEKHMQLKVEDVDRHVSIGVPEPFCNCIKRWLDLDQLTNGGNLFPNFRITEQWSKGIERWIRNIQRKNNTRLTIQRLCDYFPRRAASMPRMDSVIVGYIRGKFDLYSQTQAFYTLIEDNNIEQSVSGFWERIFDEVKLEQNGIEDSIYFEKEQDVAQQLDLKPITNIGSAKVPKAQHVKSMVNWLQEEINVTSRIRQVEKRIFEYHNAYALYTVIYFLWASCYRAVDEIFPDSRLLDQNTGLMAISDKDSEDGYSTRLIWLEEGCREQLNNYFKHLKAFGGRLAGVDQSLFQSCSALINKLEEWPPAMRTLNPRVKQDVEQISPFFIHWRDMWVPLTPRRIRDCLDSEFQLPINSNRHFTRSYLLKKIVRQELIDTHLGHWHLGLEPLAPESSMAPIQYARGIAPYLKEMLTGLGFQPINSQEVLS